MNLGSLRCIHGKWIQKHHVIDNYMLQTCHDNAMSSWRRYLGVVICDDNDDCHIIVNTRLVSP